MLIRSQDKLQLMPLEIGYVSADYRDKKSIIFCGMTGEDYTTIGRYLTETKVIKVLDTIESAYKNVNSNYKCDDDTYWQSIRDASLIFQMPQDSEVSE